MRPTPSEPDADLAVPDSWSTARLHDWTGRGATTSAVPRQGSVGTPRVRPAGFSLTRAAKRPGGRLLVKAQDYISSGTYQNGTAG